MYKTVMNNQTVIESKCPECGHLLYLIGRDTSTVDVKCTCHVIRTNTPVFKGWEQK